MDVPSLDPVFHQPARFRIMVVLLRNRQAAATWLLRTLGMTDGNLRSHAEKLVAAGFLSQGRTLTREGFEVRYRITADGDRAFRAYVENLRRMVANVGMDVVPDESTRPDP